MVSSGWKELILEFILQSKKFIYQEHYFMCKQPLHRSFNFFVWTTSTRVPNTIYLYQGCQFRFGRCFVFSIGMKCFSFEVFQRIVLELYCSHTHTYIYSINIIQIQDKLVINYAIQTHCQTNIISKFKIFLNSQD